MSFNPHTHEGCDERAQCCGSGTTVSIHTCDSSLCLHFSFRGVSIHTPTKGVTSLNPFCALDRSFQSTHPRRVWLLAVHSQSLSTCFNPHTHEGCDSDVATSIMLRYEFQSTHPRRVWPKLVCSIWRWTSSFNPHTHEGCDISLKLSFSSVSSFNPHTHEGCDKAFSESVRVPPSFNPHTHEGCDSVSSFDKGLFRVSIHTPTKGVTFARAHNGRRWSVSIHTPTKGVTRNVSSLSQVSYRFNPHTHEGCDLLFMYYAANSLCFNPHTHEGCDYLGGKHVTMRQIVSIHTPTKGVTYHW